jgi:GT2 family glycosyltransferase
MVRSTIIKRLKFEKNFFLYYEEPELSVRILKEDLKIGRILEAKCYHLESYSSPQKLADGVSFRQFYGVQNRWFMIGKHWPLRLLPTTILVNYLHLFYLMYFFVRNRKFSYLKLFYLAPVNLIKGYKSREHNKAKNKFWYKRLDKLSLTKYLVLSKKVFTKS